jgi:hypothetical protein
LDPPAHRGALKVFLGMPVRMGLTSLRRGVLSHITLSIIAAIATWAASPHLEGLASPVYADDIKPNSDKGDQATNDSTKEDPKKKPSPGAHNEKETPAPEDPPPIYDRQELLRLHDKFAIEKLGFADINGNGIPDYREFYRVNYHDCASHSATFDYILEEMGKAGVLNKQQAFGAGQIRGGSHAANWVPGIGVVDVTPIRVGGGFVASQGQPWYGFPRGTMFYQQGYPDAGEFTFAGYKGPMARTIPGVPMPGTGGGDGGLFGGGGGGGSGNMMGMLGQLLAGKNNNTGGNQSGGAGAPRPPANQGAKPPAGNSGGKTPPKPPAEPTRVPAKETPSTSGSNNVLADQKPPAAPSSAPLGTGTPNSSTSSSEGVKKSSTPAIDSMVLGGSIFDTTKKPTDDFSRPATWEIPVNPTPRPSALPAASGQNLFERQ